MSTSTYKFNIPIGDWSGDGHEKVEWFTVKSNKPIEAVREAYFIAKEKYPKLCPENYVDDYEENTIEDTLVEELVNAGAPLSFDSYEFHGLLPEELVEIVIWFIKLGDDTLELNLVMENIPMLPFYGFDEKKRHIGHFGYGLFH